MAELDGKRTQDTFDSDIADISYSHMLELMLVLGSYKDSMILVGGWVPFVLLRHFQNEAADFEHVGSKDIDIAINPDKIGKSQYRSIENLLTDKGYVSKTDKNGVTIPYSYVKNISSSKGLERVEVDFLGPEYGGTGRGRRHQIAQGNFLIRKARGAEVAFEHKLDLNLRGRLPDGAEALVTVPIADIVGIMTMKGMAIGSRYKEKDAYDIVSLLEYYKTGPNSVASEIKPYAEDKLIAEALENIALKFREANAEGPNWVADFYRYQGEIREQQKNKAFFIVTQFLKLVYDQNGKQITE
jgi:hypothetical protein